MRADNRLEVFGVYIFSAAVSMAIIAGAFIELTR
jgi:hypothetical protein